MNCQIAIIMITITNPKTNMTIMIILVISKIEMTMMIIFEIGVTWTNEQWHFQIQCSLPQSLNCL